MTQQTLQPDDTITLQAAASIAEIPPNVLKHEDSFAIIDQRGNIRPLRMRDHGLYRDGTRFLSHLLLRVADALPVVLGSAMSEDADVLVVNMTNAHIDAVHTVFQDTVHFRTEMLLWDNTLYMSLTIHNYGAQAVDVPLSLDFGADYVDIFEVRGLQREQRGEQLAPQIADDRVTLRYVGLDDIERQTVMKFAPQPEVLEDSRAAYDLTVAPGQHHTLTLSVACRYANESTEVLDFETALANTRERSTTLQDQVCQIETSHAHFNDWLHASRRDLFLLLTDTEHGLYPYAGVPWFSTVFGRDGIITALQTLWFYPEVARGVLAHLAARQATTEDLRRESEPGKILHETRPGEMANTGEIPFGGYYGTIDATPLFVILAGRYYQRTGDLAFIESLWLNIQAALRWIDHYGDIDGDGFVEYRRKNEAGILQQGWKDSNDSVFDENGELVIPPVALCEVQGYVYEAKLLASELAEAIGEPEQGQTLRRQAESLREKFLQAFWLEDLDTYAIALDGEKRPCRVRTSNAGHCLYTGIADSSHASRISAQMIEPDFFTGWGIRTLAAGEPRYNPMAYHNGTVWPHDNSLIAAGMARYGHKEAAAKVLQGLFETSQHMELQRLPELFCGFERLEREGPTLYPVACLPQAWAAASVFLMLQACLGIRVDGLRQQVIFDQPLLPHGIDSLHIHHLPLGETWIDLTIRRGDQGIEVTSDASDRIIVNI